MIQYLHFLVEESICSICLLQKNHRFFITFAFSHLLSLFFLFFISLVFHFVVSVFLLVKVSLKSQCALGYWPILVFREPSVNPPKYQSFSFLTLSYLLKVTKFLVKISNFEFLVIAEKNIFVHKLFLSLNISGFSLFFM